MVGTFFVQGVSNTMMIPRVPELIDQIGVAFTTWGLIIGLAGLGSLLSGISMQFRLMRQTSARERTMNLLEILRK